MVTCQCWDPEELSFYCHLVQRFSQWIQLWQWFFPVGCVNSLEGGKNGSDKRLCQCAHVSYHSQYFHYHSSQEAGLACHWSVHFTKTCMVIVLQINQRRGKRLSSINWNPQPTSLVTCSFSTDHWIFDKYVRWSCKIFASGGLRNFSELVSWWTFPVCCQTRALCCQVTKAALSETHRGLTFQIFVFFWIWCPAVKNPLLLFEEFAVCIVEAGRFLVGKAWIVSFSYLSRIGQRRGGGKILSRVNLLWQQVFCKKYKI